MNIRSVFVGEKAGREIQEALRGRKTNSAPVRVKSRYYYDGAAALGSGLKSVEIPPFTPEYRFHPVRKWRFDFAWPDQKVAVEYEGATWIAGRHTRGSGFAKDCEKYNTAATMGWRVLRFTAEMVKSGEAITTIQKMFRRF